MTKIYDQKQKLKQMNPDELQIELISLRKLQFESRIKRASGALDKTHQLQQVKKNIARVKTLMTEKAGKAHVE